ncbi:MAG TPA: hypothetical protein VNW15_10605 [Rhizomicrobium sp.]|nr:hypothetical protein [Rhizomicrobium sp.]
MRPGFALLLMALALCGFGGAAGAQSVPRIKATVVSFDGALLTVRPDGEKDTMKITVRPATRILKEEQKALADIPAGAFVGATVSKSAVGAFEAQEVHIFPESLRGSGEGLYPATPGSSHYILNGAVTGATAATLSVKFRGAGGDGANCTGRAPLNPLNGCQGDATIGIAAATPVMALTAADKGLIKPGAVLAVSIMAGPDGRPVTPGITIETVQTPPVPLAADPAPPPAKKLPSRVKKP